MNFPIYILEEEIIIPDPIQDISHIEFWENTVSGIISQKYKIPKKYLRNLPYSQERARIVGENVFYGGKHSPQLLRKIRNITKMKNLKFVYDIHEKTLKEEIIQLKILKASFNK